MYGDLSRPTAEEPPLAFDNNDEPKLCRISLLASALSGYPTYAKELNALVTRPVSMTDLSSQLESYTLQPEGQNGTEEPDTPSFASIGHQHKPLVNLPPVVLLHRQSVIRRQNKSANFVQSEEENQTSLDEPLPAGLVHSSLSSSYPHDARFLILSDQPSMSYCNSSSSSDPPPPPPPAAEACIEVDDTDPKTWKHHEPIRTSTRAERMRPLERPQRQNLVLKNIRYRKSARENRRECQKRRSAALSRVAPPPPPLSRENPILSVGGTV